MQPLDVDVYLALERAKGGSEREHIRDKLVFDLVNETINDMADRHPPSGGVPPYIRPRIRSGSLRQALKPESRHETSQKVRDTVHSVMMSAEEHRRRTVPKPSSDPVEQAKRTAERAADAPVPPLRRLVLEDMRAEEETWMDVELELAQTQFETADAVFEDLLLDTAEELRRVIRAKEAREW